MAITASSKEFLDHLGRMLLSRSLQFRKAYEIGDLVTADEHGYFGIDPSYGEEVFSPEFFDLLEEYFRKGELPSKSVLLEAFRSREILRADSQLERTCFARFPSFLAWRNRAEFLNIVAECFPLCFHTLNRQKFFGIKHSLESSAKNSKKNGDRLRVAHERATEPGGKFRTGHNRIPNKRIRARAPLNTHAQQQIGEFVEYVIRELLERT